MNINNSNINLSFTNYIYFKINKKLYRNDIINSFIYFHKDIDRIDYFIHNNDKIYIYIYFIYNYPLEKSTFDKIVTQIFNYFTPLHI